MLLIKNAYVVMIGKIATRESEVSDAVKIAVNLGATISENESSVFVLFRNPVLLDLYKENLEKANIKAFEFSLQESAKEKLKSVLGDNWF